MRRSGYGAAAVENRFLGNAGRMVERLAPPRCRRAVARGVAGSIGSHLCDPLLRDAYDVVCVDDHSTGARRNVGHLADDVRFTGIDAEVTRPFRVDGPIDVVSHLASPASPAAFPNDPTGTLSAGSPGTFRAVWLAVGAEGCASAGQRVVGSDRKAPPAEVAVFAADTCERPAGRRTA